ncbi:hypothetical protein NIIDMKKI_75320 [Mycobacterium kansasii]|uniref:Uncharacterized protein n=1 Tax=Mycobacterium kansasii TaxID=1768 RepID=A0A7G1IMY0_MYCKA|nr:hypothetical protein NIIDMKKI_75320 [Mycobacterium kansasii]
MFIARSERRYINQYDRVVVTRLGGAVISVWPPESGEPAGRNLAARRRRRYTADELAAVRADYERECSGEARRGAATLLGRR